MRLRQLRDELTVLASELRGLEGKVLPAIADVLKSDTQENLLRSHDPNGVQFLPLKDESGRRPLLKTLALFGAVRSFVAGNSAVCICDVEYAAAHNKGARINKPERRRPFPQKPWVFQKDGRTIFTRKIRAHTVIIPKREFMGFGERLINKVELTILKFLKIRSDILG